MILPIHRVLRREVIACDEKSDRVSEGALTAADIRGLLRLLEEILGR